MEFFLNGNISMSHDFGAETDVKYPGLNGNRNQNRPLYGKFPVFQNASFGRTLGILHILQNFVFSFIILTFSVWRFKSQASPTGRLFWGKNLKIAGLQKNRYIFRSVYHKFMK